MLQIAVMGTGRMGQSVARVIEARDDAEVSGRWSSSTGELSDVLANASVAIDFTLPEANDEIVAAVISHSVPLVCGVSGLSDSQVAAMRDAATKIAVLYDRNMSYGIAVMRRLVAQAATAMGTDATVEIHDRHHEQKRDAPSGTALMLEEIVEEARGGAGVEFVVTREGEIPGDHDVVFRTANETLTLSHSVSDRQVFAEGAVAAAEWLANQPPGFYSMPDLFNS